MEPRVGIDHDFMFSNNMPQPTLRFAIHPSAPACWTLGVMRNLRIIVLSLAVVAGGCCSRPNSSSSDADVPVLSNPAGNALVPPFAFGQLSAGRLSVVGQTKHKVYSISDGLPDVRTASKNPIVAATDQDG